VVLQKPAKGAEQLLGVLQKVAESEEQLLGIPIRLVGAPWCSSGVG
jgi:hypothetical protein